MAEDSLGADTGGYRADFLALVSRYRRLAGVVGRGLAPADWRGLVP